MTESRSHFEGDEWRDPELRDEVKGRVRKPFDRQLWLHLEMGFLFDVEHGLFINPDVGRAGRKKVACVVPVDFLNRSLATRVFQHLIRQFIDKTLLAAQDLVRKKKRT